jgi:hypothetical protein
MRILPVVVLYSTLAIAQAAARPKDLEDLKILKILREKK